MFSGVTEMHIDALKNNKKIYHNQIGAHLGYGIEESAVVTGKMYEEIGPILEKYNLFICPNALPAIKADIDIVNDHVIIMEKNKNVLISHGVCLTRSTCWVSCQFCQCLLALLQNKYQQAYKS